MTIRRLQRDDWSGFCAHATRGFLCPGGAPIDPYQCPTDWGQCMAPCDSEDNTRGSFTRGAARVAA
jgi:hypothetical protein